MMEGEILVTVDAISFPIVCCSQGLALVMDTIDELTTCNKMALNNGYFDSMSIVDSTSMEYKIRGARKLRGVGPFGGYNLFLNQRIEVALQLDEQSVQLSLEDVKQKVLRSFKQWHGWSSRGDFADLTERVQNAGSYGELIQLLRDPATMI